MWTERVGGSNRTQGFHTGDRRSFPVCLLLLPWQRRSCTPARYKWPIWSLKLELLLLAEAAAESQVECINSQVTLIRAAWILLQLLTRRWGERAGNFCLWCASEKKVSVNYQWSRTWGRKPRDALLSCVARGTIKNRLCRFYCSAPVIAFKDVGHPQWDSSVDIRKMSGEDGGGGYNFSVTSHLCLRTSSGV